VSTVRPRAPRASARFGFGLLYGVVLLLPLALISGVIKPGDHGRLVIFADALGFAALSMLALQMVASGRWASTTRAFGLRCVLALHRQAGVAVLVLVLAHVVLLLVADPSRLALLDVTSDPPRARAGVLAVVGLLALAGTSIWRGRLGLGYERWRRLHVGLTAVVITAAFAHVVWVDAYMSAPVVRWSVLTLVLAAALALFWTRVARPYATALRPYRVVEVRRERGDAVTVELAADGHAGLRFAPGQFARLRAADAFYGLDDHPFSLSSSAQRPDRPAFTVKALGDFSASLAALVAGTQLLVDGPHGEAAHDAPAVRGRLLIAAGIGITPALSVIRTAAGRRDPRPLILLYGSRRWADVTFLEELCALERRLPQLRVLHVLSRPEPSWRGEVGRVREEVIRRHAPQDLADWGALVCGPSALVADGSAALRRLGMPAAAIQGEGFE
jgi:predicted ferric reductase